MVNPLKPPARKSPLVRTQSPSLPPLARSRTAQVLTRAAAEGRFALQKCTNCGTISYPARDACADCLNDVLVLTDLPRDGVVLTETTIRAPAENYFRERPPLRIGLVQLPCGAVLVSQLHSDCGKGCKVRMSLKLDIGGNAVAFAIPEKDTPNMTEDIQWRALTADPKFRRVLVTDGRGKTGQSVAKALVDAGATTVFVGLSDVAALSGDLATLAKDPRIELVELRCDDERSVQELAALIGGKMDILVNTADYVRPGNLLDQRGAFAIREQMNRHFMGFAYLSQAFGGALMARGADGNSNAVAWVNIFSAYAHVNTSGFGAFSAVQAGCLSLSHSLRGELRGGGIRLINLFCGPVEDDWYQPLPPPKLSPAAIASQVVKALQDGTEDVWVGDIAKEIRDRLADNPKGTEREYN